MKYEAVIGLEVHAQLRTRSKIFCGCSTSFGDPPNTNTCPVCLGMPGALPVLNRQAVAMAAQAAVALGCRVNRRSLFARKNYFYPDLPKGYQISQYDQPLAGSGRVQVWTGRRDPSGQIVDRIHKTFRIHRIHLEDDAGKSIHSPGGGSYLNLNRCGVPLIEIVSEPDFRSSQEAHDYLEHLRRTLMYLGICDGNMEEGSLRCDANVSVRPRGERRLGTKLEIKNLNSFRFLQKALDYEVQRQIEVLRSGGAVEQETRLWDEEGNRTALMRSKEEAQDYRYFPDPDLLPVRISEESLQDLKSSLPELPEPRRQRLGQEHGLEGEEALMLVQSRAFADYFEAAVGQGTAARAAYNWMMGGLTRLLKADRRGIEQCPVSPQSLSELIQMVDNGAISGKIAKDVLEKMYRQGKDAGTVVEQEGLRQISDSAALEEMIDTVLMAEPAKVEAYRGGKTGLLGFFVGQVMGQTRGQAHPQLVNRILKEKLDQS
ncbi:MAG: Asp-tRNA(Asn)/Glu-tRNA(Gln) amidotransferase subunit GatB [Acidobacteriota bacterium]